MSVSDSDSIKLQDKTIHGLVQLLSDSEKERKNLQTIIEDLKEKQDNEERRKFCMTDKSTQTSTAELSTDDTSGALSSKAAYSNNNTRENVKNTDTCVNKNADAERHKKDRRRERNNSGVSDTNVDMLTGNSVAQSVDCAEGNVDGTFPEHKTKDGDSFTKMETLKSEFENDFAGEYSSSSSYNDNEMNCHEMNRDIAPGETDGRTSTIVSNENTNLLCCSGHLQNSETVQGNVQGENIFLNHLGTIFGWVGSLVDR